MLSIFVSTEIISTSSADLQRLGTRSPIFVLQVINKLPESMSATTQKIRNVKQIAVNKWRLGLHNPNPTQHNWFDFRWALIGLGQVFKQS